MKRVTSCSHGPDQRMTASHLTTSAHQAYTFAGPSFNTQNVPDIYPMYKHIVPNIAVPCGHHTRRAVTRIAQYHDIGRDGRVLISESRLAFCVLNCSVCKCSAMTLGTATRELAGRQLRPSRACTGPVQHYYDLG